MAESAVQFLNACASIRTTVSDTIMLVMRPQSSNAALPIVSTEAGMSAAANFRQLLKVLSAIMWIERESVILVRLQQPSNAPGLTSITESGIITSVSCAQPAKAQHPILVTE